jgi:uncharacterized protein DUF5667
MINTMLVSPAQRRRAQEFAELLEGRRHAAGHELQPLVQLATTLRPAHLQPSPDFSAALRERLVDEASSREAATGGLPPRPDRRTVRPQHRLRQAVAGAVAATLIAGTGAAVASTRAVPGDALYGVKRSLESAQLSLAGSDLSRGQELLEQADHRLSEAETLVASGSSSDPATRARIAQALDDMQDALKDGASTLTGAYSTSGDVKAMTVLNRFAGKQRDRLDTLLTRLAQLDPPASALRRQAEAIARLLDQLAGEAAAVLPAEATAAESPARPLPVAAGTRSGDGWASSRMSAAADGSSPTGAGAAGGSSESAGSSGTGGSGGAATTQSTPAPGRDLIQDVTGSLAKAGGKVGPSAGPSAVSVPSVGVPLPTVAVPSPGGNVPGTSLKVPCVPLEPLPTC